MARIGDFDQHRVDHRQVRRDGHAVVEEARVLEAPVLVVDIFLVEGPADALRDAALQLALDIGGMNGGADILHGGVAEDFDRAGFLVDFHVADMGAEAGAGAARGELRMAVDGAAGGRRGRGDLRQGQRFEIPRVAARRAGPAIVPHHRVDGDVPLLRGAAAHFLDALLRRIDHGHAAGEGHAAAAGQETVADGTGVGDDGTDLRDVDAEHFGGHDGHGGAAAADVRVPRRDGRGAVFVDVHFGARFAADVEPEAGGDAASLLRPQLGLVVRVVFRRGEGFDIADGAEFGAVGGLRAFLRGVFLPQFDGVHPDLAREFVDDAFDPEFGDRRAGSAVGGDFRAVGHHVVADDEDVLQIVGREGGHAAGADGGAGIGAGLVFQLGLGGDDASVAGDADLDAGRRARSGTAGPEDFLAGHRHAHGAARLFRQQDGDGFEIDKGLAAEAAADLRRGDADLRRLDAEDVGGVVADHELALAGAPDLDLAVLGIFGDRGVRLNIALMDRLGGEGAFDGRVGVREALADIAEFEFHALGDVGRALGRRSHPFGEQIVMEDRRVLGHRLLHVDDVGQRLVGDLDELGGAARGGGARRGDGGDGVTVIEGLIARHDVGGQVAEIDLRLAGGEELGAVERGEIGRGDDRLDARRRLGFRRVDGEDAGMRVRAAHHRAVQHAGKVEVGAEARAPGDLVDAVGANRPRADDAVFGVAVLHGQPPLISAAAL